MTNDAPNGAWSAILAKTTSDTSVDAYIDDNDVCLEEADEKDGTDKLNPSHKSEFKPPAADTAHVAQPHPIVTTHTLL